MTNKVQVREIDPGVWGFVAIFSGREGQTFLADEYSDEIRLDSEAEALEYARENGWKVVR